MLLDARHLLNKEQPCAREGYENAGCDCPLMPSILRVTVTRQGAIKCQYKTRHHKLSV
jgi:hypothetical protein